MRERERGREGEREGGNKRAKKGQKERGGREGGLLLIHTHSGHILIQKK